MTHETPLISKYALVTEVGTFDLSIFVQVGLFFASYFVLNRLVFRPYLALLKNRRDQTVGLREAAERDRVEAEKKRLEYETFLKTERKKVTSWSEEERKKVQDEERKIIQAARNAAAHASEIARGALEEERRSALRSLEATVNEFASAIVSKMLGRKVQVAGTSAKSSHGKESLVET